MKSKFLSVMCSVCITALTLETPYCVEAAEETQAMEILAAEAPAIDAQVMEASMTDALGIDALAMSTSTPADGIPGTEDLITDLSALTAPSDELSALMLSANVDYETALLLNAQAELAAQGISLQKYNRINILGDSITEGVGARTPDKAYPVVLSKLTGAVVNNYGLSCSRITDVSSEVSNPASFIDRMYSMDKTADLVIVFGGTNDFWFGDCPIGKRTDTGTGTFYGALNTMIPYLKGAYPNADIVFIVPYQQSKDADMTHPYKRSTYGNFGTGTLKQYRTAMLDRCEYYGVPVLDLYADYDLNTADNREALEMYGNYVCDGCHLNDAGYNLLARKIYRFIMQDLTEYVPEYTEINDMTFETAALPALIQNGSFVMPNGEVILSKPGYEVDLTMPLQQLYQNLIISAMY